MKTLIAVLTAAAMLATSAIASTWPGLSENARIPGIPSTDTRTLM
jgi:hypothetical protein